MIAWKIEHVRMHVEYTALNFAFLHLGQDGVYIFKVYEWEPEKPTGVHAYEFPTSGTLKKSLRCYSA